MTPEETRDAAIKQADSEYQKAVLPARQKHADTEGAARAVYFAAIKADEEALYAVHQAASRVYLAAVADAHAAYQAAITNNSLRRVCETARNCSAISCASGLTACYAPLREADPWANWLLLGGEAERSGGVMRPGSFWSVPVILRRRG